METRRLKPTTRTSRNWPNYVRCFERDDWNIPVTLDWGTLDRGFWVGFIINCFKESHVVVKWLKANKPNRENVILREFLQCIPAWHSFKYVFQSCSSVLCKNALLSPTLYTGSTCRIPMVFQYTLDQPVYTVKDSLESCSSMTVFTSLHGNNLHFFLLVSSLVKFLVDSARYEGAFCSSAKIWGVSFPLVSLFTLLYLRTSGQVGYLSLIPEKKHIGPAFL